MIELVERLLLNRVRSIAINKVRQVTGLSAPTPHWAFRTNRHLALSHRFGLKKVPARISQQGIWRESYPTVAKIVRQIVAQREILALQRRGICHKDVT